MADDQFPMKLWKHPKTGKKRVYINGEDVEDVKVWFEAAPGGIAQVCTNGDAQKAGAVASWIQEEAMAKGMMVADYIAKMALEDVGLTLPCLFDNVVAQAE